MAGLLQTICKEVGVSYLKFGYSSDYELLLYQLFMQPF